MALIAADLHKTYGRVAAVRGASLTVEPGQIHGLVGENGAGKSTVVRLLAGIENPDSGTVESHGLRCAVVPQYPRMAPSIPVLANLMVGSRDSRLFLNFPRAAGQVAEMSRRYGISLDNSKRAGDLNGTELRLAALLAALMQNPDIVILDEPTVGLAQGDQERVLSTVRMLRDGGKGVLYISHDLREVCRIADRVTIVSAGQTGAPLDPPFDPATLAERLFGASAPLAPDLRETREEESRRQDSPNEPGLEFEQATLFDGITGRSLGPITFSSPRYRITAVTGVREAGLDLLEDYFSGRCDLASGAIRAGAYERLAGRVAPPELRRRGIAFVPSDRFERAAALEGSVEENATVTDRNAVHHRGIRLPAGVQQVTTRLLDRFGIKTEWHLPLGSLSGGTIQKLILSRELDSHPDVCIIAEPTAGLDLQSQQHLLSILRDVAAGGAAVLLLTSSIEAATTLAEEVVVLHGGGLQGIHSADRRDHIARSFAGLPGGELHPQRGGP